MLEEAGTLDVGDLVLHSFRLLRTKALGRITLCGRAGYTILAVRSIMRGSTTKIL